MADEVPNKNTTFATVWNLAYPQDHVMRTESFSRPEDFTHFVSKYERWKTHPTNLEPEPLANRSETFGSSTPSASQPPGSPNKFSSRVVFLQGFASPQWLNEIGSSLNVDPEFFYRHMVVPISSLPNAARPGYNFSAPFPSTSDIVQFRICNTGAWDTSRSQFSVKELRDECAKSMGQHIEDFVKCRNLAVGDSIVRRFTIHDLENFTLEQRISMELIQSHQGWTSE